MIKTLISKIFGNKQARDMKRLQPIVDEINEIAEEYQALTEEELQGKTDEFRARLEQGETLEDLLPEAFAAVKEACRRHVGQTWMAAGVEINWEIVPYDVQLVGGIALHEGKIAEMATGEGKTMVAVAPLYLNALAGKGAHLVTVNDYLARRDSEWMGKIFTYLGLTVGCLDTTESNSPERRAMYECDITYGTNHEFGFDFLRDNMVTEADQMVQRRGHFFAIVDEVDNILIDEARTPLIISGPVDRSTHRYDEIKPMVLDLVKKQNELLNQRMNEGEALWRDGKSREAGELFLQVQRGLPKHKRLARMKTETGVGTAIEKVELEYLGEKKMPQLDEQIYYVVDEKSHQIDLTEIGRVALSPDNPKLWEMPDIVEEVSTIENGEFDVLELTNGQKLLLNGSPAERAAARQPDGSYEIHRHDGVVKLPADAVVRQIPGSEIDKADRDQIKELIRAEHGIQAEKLHNISQMLRAYTLYEKGDQYIVQDNKVIIVDEFTGRLMTGRRWSDGLHQAVEAKEGVEIEAEMQTLATVTLQNYFRLYGKLAGMTGTAETEAGEFNHTYKMDVMVIPTNRGIRRIDEEDVIFKTKQEKFKAVVDEIARLHEENLPVLVGTVSVEVSELLSRYLRTRKIPHEVLNAKNHQREADIVREAGHPGRVTIATNMAGRGTDIKLHADVMRRNAEGVAQGAGLQVIGTERHESRRIDRQLRGRSGRQGDPGRSKFFLSLEDDLMRLFGSDRISRIMDRMGLGEGEEITHPWVTRAIESAQKKVEGRNFEVRKRTLDYDNVMNKQREAVYGLRREVLLGDDLKDLLMSIHFDALNNQVNEFGDKSRQAQEWDLEGFLEYVQRHIPYADFKSNPERLHGLMADDVLEDLIAKVEEAYETKREQVGDEMLLRLARYVVLTRIDANWRDHLLAIDEMRDNVGWRGFAQLDPLVEYQKEASVLFEELMFNIHREVAEHFFLTQPAMQLPEADQQVLRMEAHKQDADDLPPMVQEAPPEPDYEDVMEALEGEMGFAEEEEHGRATGGQAAGRPGAKSGKSNGRRPVQQPITRVGPKVGPNDPCPCGSGKKFKKCHGKTIGAEV